jgi:hypothetical protein
VSSLRPCCLTYFWQFLQFLLNFSWQQRDFANKIRIGLIVRCAGCKGNKPTGGQLQPIIWQVGGGCQNKNLEIDSSIINIYSRNMAEECSARCNKVRIRKKHTLYFCKQNRNGGQLQIVFSTTEMLSVASDYWHWSAYQRTKGIYVKLCGVIGTAD